MFLKFFDIVYNVKMEKKLARSFAFKVNMAKNFRISTSNISTLVKRLLMNFIIPSLPTNWDCRKEESYLARSGESNALCHGTAYGVSLSDFWVFY